MKEKCLLRNEDGSVLVLAVIILSVLTLLGMSATTTTDIELRIAENERSHKIAFYTAEGAEAYVAGNPDLYGPDNITVGQQIAYPDEADPTVKYPLGSSQSLNGNVVYIGPSAPPRGSGYAADKFKAHNYQMTCRGYGPSNATSQIQSGFYRIGF